MNPFNTLVDAFADSPSEDVMYRLINHIEHNTPTDEELAYFALRIAESGVMLSTYGSNPSADISSTGGPSSLSTLICPLYLRALGYIVPTLTVSGRPAGGIDVLAQVPGYKVDFTVTEVQRILKQSGYIHFIASQTFAPHDAILYSYRKQINKINIPEIAIASILSKKKATSVSLLGLDVRVSPHGNFGTNFDTASQHAKQFCSVASILGIQARCFLTDASIPYQPFIGRGEALIAMYNILTGHADSWLRNHEDVCYEMVKRLCQMDKKRCTTPRPSADALLSVFKENLEIQGSSFEMFEKYVSKIIKKHEQHITAQQTGFLYVDLESLRNLLVRMQVSTNSELPFPDPCGVILKQPSGAYVHKGDTIATVRSINNYADEMRLGVTAALKIMKEPISSQPMGEVSHA